MRAQNAAQPAHRGGTACAPAARRSAPPAMGGRWGTTYAAPFDVTHPHRPPAYCRLITLLPARSPSCACSPTPHPSPRPRTCPTYLCSSSVAASAATRADTAPYVLRLPPHNLQPRSSRSSSPSSPSRCPPSSRCASPSQRASRCCRCVCGGGDAPALPACPRGPDTPLPSHTHTPP